eukprot:TRINITY_DN21060_c0_g1_i1.p1 TRINITY_DN21060_c0_g1~~TRINITY_DN21060_c0_g1_i1.p1  ORF type:complete len:529 (+),score=77.66 TRINITY_DN21060_c0_g1_i1:184-1587(+)
MAVSIGGSGDSNGGGPCDGDHVDSCVTRLAQRGRVVFWPTVAYAHNCGAETNLLELLNEPWRLPPGRPRRLLMSRSERSDVDAMISLVVATFSSVRATVNLLWQMAVAHTHACVVEEEAAPSVVSSPCAASTRRLVAALRKSYGSFLRNVSMLMHRATGIVEKGSHWLPSIGDPAHIVSTGLLAQRHLRLWSSLVHGLPTMEPVAGATALLELARRLADGNCEMRAQLIAHFALTLLPLALVSRTPSPTRRSEVVAKESPSRQMPLFPSLPIRIDFQSGVGAMRYHILAHLLAQKQSQQSRLMQVVEVGVNNGATSEYLLERFRFLQFDGVDPYVGGVGVEYARALAERRFARFAPVARLRRLPSVVAAARFPLQSLDLVFIDGDHRREAVAIDIRAWLPRVRPGGLLVGHDIFNVLEDGVLLAVLAHLNVSTASTGNTSLLPSLPLPAEAPQTLKFGLDHTWWLEL